MIRALIVSRVVRVGSDLDLFSYQFVCFLRVESIVSQGIGSGYWVVIDVCNLMN